jgi:hypothetical protein
LFSICAEALESSEDESSIIYDKLCKDFHIDSL